MQLFSVLYHSNELIKRASVTWQAGDVAKTFSRWSRLISETFFWRCVDETQKVSFELRIFKVWALMSLAHFDCQHARRRKRPKESRSLKSISGCHDSSRVLSVIQSLSGLLLNVWARVLTESTWLKFFEILIGAWIQRQPTCRLLDSAAEFSVRKCVMIRLNESLLKCSPFYAARCSTRSYGSLPLVSAQSIVPTPRWIHLLKAFRILKKFIILFRNRSSNEAHSLSRTHQQTDAFFQLRLDD